MCIPVLAVGVGEGDIHSLCGYDLHNHVDKSDCALCGTHLRCAGQKVTGRADVACGVHAFSQK
jgi:hypothetical protein